MVDAAPARTGSCWFKKLYREFEFLSLRHAVSDAEKLRSSRAERREKRKHTRIHSALKMLPVVFAEKIAASKNGEFLL
jgi:hypothetical protein